MFTTSNKFQPYQDTLANYLYLSPFVIVLVYVVSFRFLSPLARLPGPFNASLSRIWLLWHSWKGDMHRTMIDLHRKHGKLVRTGPNEVSVSDLTAIKTIYGEYYHRLGVTS